MIFKRFVLKSTCILLAVGIILVSGKIANGSEEKKDPSKTAPAITGAQIQSHLMSFADRFVSILDTVIAQFEHHNPQGKSRYEILELITLSAHHAFIIAVESDANVALLDMLSMITLGRIFFEQEGASRYGDVVAPVLKGFRKAEADIRRVAGRVLSPEQIRNLMTIIENWRKNNPEVKSFPLVRFSNFAADRRESTLTKAETPEGLFDSVESASETVEEMRLLAERSVYMATRMPQLIGLFGDLWLSRWMNTPDMQRSRADVAVLSESAQRLASSVEQLPDQIKSEREATIKLLMAYVSQERHLAVDELVNGIAAERKAALGELLAEERQIENRLTNKLLDVVNQLELQGKNLIDHVMRRLAFLLFIGLIGYIMATLFVRFVSNKVDAFGKGF